MSRRDFAAAMKEAARKSAATGMAERREIFLRAQRSRFPW